MTESSMPSLDTGSMFSQSGYGRFRYGRQWSAGSCGGEDVMPEGRLRRPCCENKLWMFVALGVLMIILGFLMGVVYFSIRALTTSLEHTAVIPTYANAILIICNGILVIILYKRRERMIMLAAIVVSASCALLCLSSAALTGSNVLRPMYSFKECHYDSLQMRCHCYIALRDNGSWTSRQSAEYVYYQTHSCRAIQKNLLEFMCTLLAFYSIAFFICLAGTVLGIQVFKNEQEKWRLLENECFLNPPSTPDPVSSSSESANFTYFSNPVSPAPRAATRYPEVILARREGEESQEPPLETGNQETPLSLSTLLSRRITLPGDSRPRLLGVRRNDSLNGSIVSGIDNISMLDGNTNTGVQNSNGAHDVGADSSSIYSIDNVIAPCPPDINLDQRFQELSNEIGALWELHIAQLRALHSCNPTRYPPSSRGRQQRSRTLPSEPLHRGTYSGLPSVPMTRQSNLERMLPPSPVRRGSTLSRVEHGNSVGRRLFRSRSTTRSSVTQQTTRSMNQVGSHPRHRLHHRASLVGLLNAFASMNSIPEQAMRFEPPPPYTPLPPYNASDPVPEYQSNDTNQALDCSISQLEGRRDREQDGNATHVINGSQGNMTSGQESVEIFESSQAADPPSRTESPINSSTLNRNPLATVPELAETAI